MQYVIEPIVPLANPRMLAWGEILLRETNPLTLKQWRDWYAWLPNLVSQTLRETSYKLLSVNVDSLQVLDEEIHSSLTLMGGMRVALEWTERHDPAVGFAERTEVGRRLQALRREHGFPVCLDDYGAGEDGLGRLCACKPDLIKLDGHVFQGAREDTRIEEVLRQHASFCRALSTVMVVEWIETRRDLNLAKRIGAQWGQGYLWMSLDASVQHDLADTA